MRRVLVAVMFAALLDKKALMAAYDASRLAICVLVAVLVVLVLLLVLLV